MMFVAVVLAMLPVSVTLLGTSVEGSPGQIGTFAEAWGPGSNVSTSGPYYLPAALVALDPSFVVPSGEDAGSANLLRSACGGAATGPLVGSMFLFVAGIVLMAAYRPIVHGVSVLVSTVAAG